MAEHNEDARRATRPGPPVSADMVAEVDIRSIEQALDMMTAVRTGPSLARRLREEDLAPAPPRDDLAEHVIRFLARSYLADDHPILLACQQHPPTTLPEGAGR
jgi:hypothetical protein